MSRNDQLADVIRVHQTLKKNGADSEKLYARYSGTTQEPVRLAAALYGYFHTDCFPAHRQEFEAYLRRRIRPAAEVLIVMEALEELEQLEQLGWFDAALVDHFLTLACSHRKSAVLVWLLHLKHRKYGFHDRTFDL